MPIHIISPYPIIQTTPLENQPFTPSILCLLFTHFITSVYFMRPSFCFSELAKNYSFQTE